MKSPIKDNPLRNPGESLDKQIDTLINDKATNYLMWIAFTILLAGLEWYRWYFEVQNNPLVYTFLTMLVIPYCVFKLVAIRKQVKHLKQGRDGEKAVGQYLENLRETSAKVFHDIPAKGFNIDHVVIAKSGIYVIETKTYSKPDTGSPKVIFDGTSLKFSSGFATNKPLIQVEASSHWLRDLIKETTGKSFAIKPVIVFPGWYAEPTSEAKSSDVWVLNPKGLPTFIANSKEKMTAEEISLVAFHLSRYVRSYKED
nr:nuclease-related domain-containing protein [Methylophaga lonarensis]